jgi:hypothetical protein
MEQDYKKSWNTLKAESSGRWCQPHPLSNELLTIGELMRNIERRTSETEELAATDSQQPQGKMPAGQQCCIHHLVCSIKVNMCGCPCSCGHYRPMR